MYLGGKKGKKLRGGACSLPGKGQALKERNKLAARFSNNGFFSLFFGSNWGGKEGVKVMGVIRKEELCCLSQSQTNTPIYIQNLPDTKRDL